jgi:hypothetical protein
MVRLFIKDNIPADDSLPFIWVPKSPGLVVQRITKKYTLLSVRSEVFPLVLLDVYIGLLKAKMLCII